MNSFTDLKLKQELLRAVASEGYTTPTPIQEQAIPLVLQGRDLLGCAQTGTGKTAAFALPIIQRLTMGPQTKKHRLRVLILTPTRELASQIGQSFASYGRHTGLRHVVVFGGVNQNPQTQAIRRGVDILVATPGRLIDLTNQGFIKYHDLEVFVLDEADRMMDMGFIHDVRRIVKMVPSKRQTLLFSATMPKEIRALADSILSNPLSVSVDPPASTVDLIDQNLYYVEKENKVNLLIHLMKETDKFRVLIFTRTKYGADKVCKKLQRARIEADAIHGNKSQNARTRALSNFKSGRTQVLVATDIASRGIDVDNITHVINFDLPYEPESYVHRIGRTGRAGMEGTAISFCDQEERKYLAMIERTIKQRIPVCTDDYPYRSHVKAPAQAARKSSGPARSRSPYKQKSASSAKRSKGGFSAGSYNRNKRPEHTSTQSVH